MKVDVPLNDLGTSQCLLVPRNIPTYSHILSSPFENSMLYIFLFSLLIIAILWKIFRILQKQKLNIFRLVVDILKIIIGYPIDDQDFNRWTLKERLLLFPFIVICFVLMEIFVSDIVSTSIVEQPMRSVKSIEELILSDTKVNEYYKELTLFPEEKVINRTPVLLGSSELSKLPENFDRNLAYVVRCKFAEEFVNSDKNFDENRQLFDILGSYAEKTQGHYLVSENFPFKNEFLAYILSLEESGILDYWVEKAVRESFPKHVEYSGESSLLLEAFYLPFIILGTGIVISIFIITIEASYVKFRNWKLNRVTDLRKERERRQKYRKFYKFLTYFSRNNKENKSEVICRQRTVFEIEEEEEA